MTCFSAFQTNYFWLFSSVIASYKASIFLMTSISTFRTRQNIICTFRCSMTCLVASEAKMVRARLIYLMISCPTVFTRFWKCFIWTVSSNMTNLLTVEASNSFISFWREKSSYLLLFFWLTFGFFQRCSLWLRHYSIR